MPRTMKEANLSIKSLRFTSATLLENPTLAAYPMQTIAQWSQIDMLLGTLLSGLLKSNLPETLALYQLAQGHDRRREVLETIADFIAAENNRLILKATLREINSWRTERDAFAHQVWGTSPEIPDTLLLAKPSLKAVMAYTAGEQNAALQELIITRAPKENILVYHRTDLEAALEKSNKAQRYVHLLNTILLAGAESAQALDELMKNSEIKTRFDSLKKAEAKRTATKKK